MSAILCPDNAIESLILSLPNVHFGVDMGKACVMAAPGIKMNVWSEKYDFLCLSNFKLLRQKIVISPPCAKTLATSLNVHFFLSSFALLLKSHTTCQSPTIKRNGSQNVRCI